jgi:hypothetical protein
LEGAQSPRERSVGDSQRGCRRLAQCRRRYVMRFGDLRERLLLTDTAGDVVNFDQPGAAASIHIGE